MLLALWPSFDVAMLSAVIQDLQPPALLGQVNTMARLTCLAVWKHSATQDTTEEPSAKATTSQGTVSTITEICSSPPLCKNQYVKMWSGAILILRQYSMFRLKDCFIALNWGLMSMSTCTLISRYYFGHSSILFLFWHLWSKKYPCNNPYKLLSQLWEIQVRYLGYIDISWYMPYSVYFWCSWSAWAQFPQ